MVLGLGREILIRKCKPKCFGVNFHNVCNLTSNGMCTMGGQTEGEQANTAKVLTFVGFR